MEKIQLLSVVFSIIMAIALTAGPGIAYAGLDDSIDESREMESMEDESNEDESNEDESNEDESNEDESERDNSMKDHSDGTEHDKRVMMDRYCEMSPVDQAAFLEKYPMTSDHKDKMESDHKDKMTEYCSLDESGRDALIEEYKDTMKNDMRAMVDKYCEMSPVDQAAFLEKYPMTSDHKDKMESDHKDKMTEYCSLDEIERKAFFEKHYVAMHDNKSDHKDSMKNRLCDSENDVECKTWDHDYNMTDKMSDHKDSMTDKISDHKDVMTDKMSDHKSYKGLKASALTDEQKSDIKAMHMELRDLKHSMKGNSTGLDKEEIQNQFMMKTKEFSMGWLSPRHQIAAGIDAQMVECHEGHSLVLKTSNQAPICVKESTAEKLIKRGIAISAI